MQTQFVTQTAPQTSRRPAAPAPTWKNGVQVAADVLGLIPLLNVPTEIGSRLISLRRRDYVGFGLSVAGLVPLGGEAAVALKLARTAHQTLSEQTARAA